MLRACLVQLRPPPLSGWVCRLLALSLLRAACSGIRLRCGRARAAVGSRHPSFDFLFASSASRTLAATVHPSVFSSLPLLPVQASSFAALFAANQVFLIIAPSSLFQCLAPPPFVISLDVAVDHLSSTSSPGALAGAREADCLILLRSVQLARSTLACLRLHQSFLLLCPVCCVVLSVTSFCASFPLIKKIFCNITAKSFSENPAAWASCRPPRWLLFSGGLGHFSCFSVYAIVFIVHQASLMQKTSGVPQGGSPSPSGAFSGSGLSGHCSDFLSSPSQMS